MTLTWSAETMGTGVPELDRQHQELIARLNQFFTAIQQGQGTAALESLLEFAGTYAAWHFTQEEQCRRGYCCPAAALNKQQHATFIRTVDKLRQRIHSEGPHVALMQEVERRLSGWVSQHITRVDTQLKPCVRTASAIRGTRDSGQG